MLSGLAVLTSLLSFADDWKPLYEQWLPQKTGITWQHDNAHSERRYQPETIGPGVALFDFDNDGLVDIYFPNSGPSDIYRPAQLTRGALYKNNSDGSFTDVTARAGVGNSDSFGIGAAAADYDGDGWIDLLVTNYGRNKLFHNQRDGTFQEVGQEAGLDASGLFTSAVWFDYDNDGHLDLFLGHFVEYSKALERDCRTGSTYHYCYPLSYDPYPSKLYRNNGDGTFHDVSEQSGIGRFRGKAFSAVAVDIDGDGYLDLFVSNDSVSNFLFHNEGNGVFTEIGLQAGVGYSDDGVARSGMGVDAADYDGDGKPDLFVANFNRERSSLYRNLDGKHFADEAGAAGIGRMTYPYSGWGVRFFDFDLDGDLDLLMVNGHPDDLIETFHNGLKWKEPLLLMENRGGKFVDSAEKAGELFRRGYTARGLAVGDLDNDGWPDIVVGVNGNAPVLLHRIAGANHWIGLSGLQPGCKIRWPGGIRFVTAGGSFLSSQDPRLVIGLGTKDVADWIEIDWPAPAKHTQRLEHVPAGRYYGAR